MSLKLKSDTHFQLCTPHLCNYSNVLNWKFSRLLEVIFQKNRMKKNYALVEKLNNLQNLYLWNEKRYHRNSNGFELLRTWRYADRIFEKI